VGKALDDGKSEAREQFGTMSDPATQQFLIFGGYEFTTNTFYPDTSQLQ